MHYNDFHSNQSNSYQFLISTQFSIFVYLLAVQNNIFPIDFPKAFGAELAKVLFSINAFSLKLYAVSKTLQFAHDSETERKISSSLLMPLLELGIFTDAIVRTWNIYHVYWCHCQNLEYLQFFINKKYKCIYLLIIIVSYSLFLQLFYSGYNISENLSPMGSC